MKLNLTKRLLSLLLCLCLLLTIFAGLTIISAANEVRNWGKRDTLCTSLSQAALDYYTGDYAYETLKTLSGASTTADSLSAAKNNQLYNTLYTLMSSTHTNTSITYSSHSSWYAYTDCENGDTSGKMKLIWAGGYRTWDGSYVNREHVWCQSHASFYQSGGGADLHHLRPASAYINQTPHNDRPYGMASEHGGTSYNDEAGNFGGWMMSANSNYPGGLYEPPDNAKGDCARILLYVYTRWKQPNLYTSYDPNNKDFKNFVDPGEDTSDGDYVIESLDVLLQWMEDDPVDTWEMGRNDSAQSIQGNRNVFIDYPELAWYMFGLTPPNDMDTPSGDAKSGPATVYEITNVNVNNPSWGSAVITNGNTVTVTPAEGYRLNTATATSGTVSINGNVITVTGMRADTTVNVIFEQIPQYTVTYIAAGTELSTVSVNQGSSLTLPSTASNINGYTFLGWVSSEINDEVTTQPTTILTGTYTPTKNTTLYALYQRTETIDNPKPAGYTYVDEAPAAGDTVILARLVSNKYYGMTTASTPGNSELTVSNGEITNAGSTAWTVSAAGGSNVYLQPSGASTYLHLENNALSVANNTNNAGITFTSNGDGTFKATRSDGKRWIVTSGIRGLSCSATEANAAKLYIFKYHPAQAASTTYYTTDPHCAHERHTIANEAAATCTEAGYSGDEVCADCGAVITPGHVIPALGHTVVDDPAVAATCTGDGKTAGSHCSVCNAVLTAQTTVPALGHNYTSEITTAATCTQNGVKTYTCSRCSDSYTETIQKLGHDYDNGVVTTAATCGAKGVKTFTCSRCHNTYTQDIPATGNHSYDSGSTTTYATCTAPGVKTFTCTVCRKTRTETISPLGHDYNSSITKYATCGADGVRTYTCSRCYDSYTEVIPATGNHNYYSSITTQPTCTTAGVKTYTCYTCGDKYTETISATGHDYGSATSNNNPEFHTYYCQNFGCSSSYTEPHTFTESTSGYYRTFTCSGCGYSYSITLNTYVVTYNDQGVESRVNVIEGSSTTPPATGSGADGFTFAGWSFTPVTEESTSVTLQTASFKPTADVTLYAIYSRTEEGGDANTFKLVTNASQLEEGRNVIIAAKDYDYSLGGILNKYYRDQIAILKNGNSVSVNDDLYFFSLSKQNNKWSLWDYANDGYLTAYTSGEYYDLGTESSLSNNSKFTISVASDGTATIYSNADCYIRYVRDNGYEEFACRSSASDDLDIALYIEAPSSTTYYTSTPHPKETYIVSYSELGTVTGTDSVLEGNSITLPATAAAAEGYEFLGWVDAQIYNETTDEPVILTGSYTPTASVTLYAAYMRTQPGEGPAASLVKMNTGDTLNNGDKIVVIADGTDYVMYQQTRSGSYVMYKDFTNDTLTARDVANDDKYYFDVTAVQGGYKLGDATNGYLYNSSSNNLACSTENSSVFTLTDNEDGTFYLMIGSRWLTSRTDLTTSNANYYRLNSGSGSKNLNIYKYTPGAVDVLYYTTNPTGTEECVHPATTLVDALDATCTDNGYTGDEICDICGETVTEGSVITALGHDYAATVVSPATYIADGEMSYTCSRCEDTYTEAIPQLVIGEAATGDYRVVTEITDDLSGTYLIVYEEGGIAFNGSLSFPNVSGNYQTVTIEDGVIRGGDAVDALAVQIQKDEDTDIYTILLGSGKYIGNGGNGADLNYNTAPYYNNVGIDTSCNAIIANASGRNTYYFRFNPATVSNRFSFYATSTGYKVKLYKRVECEHENTHTEDALAATCTEPGFTGNTVCDDCGITVAAGTEIAVLGHDIIVDAGYAANCTTAGLTDGEHCSRCDYAVAQEVIPAAGHSYTENGICTVCSDKLISITSAYLRLDEDIDVIYTAKVPEGATASMTFTMNGNTVTVEDDGSHSFAFEGVNPQCMGDNISATLTVTVDGVTYTCTKEEYSVRIYCVNKLADETVTGAARKLISDTLAYGAAAQTYVGYKTNELVNTGDDILNPDYSSFTSLSGLGASFEGTAAENICWTGASLKLTDNVGMTFRFYAESIDGLAIFVTIDNRTQTFTEFTAVGENLYEITFYGIKATEFGDTVSASFSTGGNTVNYSVNAYVCAKQADGNTALANLVKALYNYGVSAEAFAE